MTSAPSTALDTSCPECGAAVPNGREACQRLSDEILAREFGDYRYARMHRLTVDVYALQHPAEYMRSAKSYAAHLTGMYAALKEGGAGVAELLATPEQREKLAQMTALLSLLEGHADVVMDAVGPPISPSVAQIRARFNERRKGVGAFDRLLRRLLGLEAKMRQYRDGAVFVRAVIDEVGMDGFNRVWTSPETLPLPREIEEPAAWVARVHA